MRNNTVPALILGVSFIVGLAILAGTWRGNVKAAQTLKVTGSARMDLTSDLGRLQFTVQARGTTAEAAWQDLQRQIPVVKGYLGDNAVPDAALETFPVNAWTIEEFDEQGNRTGRVLSHHDEQSFRVELNDVQLIESLSLELAGLVTQGVAVRTSMPEYLVTGLAEVKEEVQALAADGLAACCCRRRSVWRCWSSAAIRAGRITRPIWAWS